MGTYVKWALVALVVLSWTPFAAAETSVRVATYNIKWLNKDVGDDGDRLNKLKQVISLLEADIIGLQEIADRTALEKVFPKKDWHLVIDDDGGELQDLALAVRKRWGSVPDFPSTPDAEPTNFLFPDSSDNYYFPDKRDVLAVKVRAASEPVEFYVMVVHAKSRYGGRATTDAKRVGAARMIVEKIKTDYDDVPFILLGDFNDNPDDQSLNILETGDPDALPGPEQIPGPFLVNLTEALCADDHVTQGLKSDAVDGDLLNTIDPGSRDRNNEYRGTNVNTGDILFDQILIPASITETYVASSIKVFGYGVAAKGNNTTRASDHVPVYADFVFTLEDPTLPPPTGLRIVALLPNPRGKDDFREQVTLENPTSQDIGLQGWRLLDVAANEFKFSGTIPANSTLTVTMARGAFLNNLGDEVWLVDPSGVAGPHLTYTAAQAKKGKVVTFL